MKVNISDANANLSEFFNRVPTILTEGAGGWVGERSMGSNYDGHN